MAGFSFNDVLSQAGFKDEEEKEKEQQATQQQEESDGYTIDEVMEDQRKDLTAKTIRAADVISQSRMVRVPGGIAGRGVARGLESAAHITQAISQAVGAENYAQTAGRAAERLEAVQQGPFRQTRETIEASGKDLSDKPLIWWTENAGDVAFDLIKYLGANSVLPGSGMVAAGTEQAGQIRGDTYNRLKQSGQYTEQEARDIANGEGIIGGLVTGIVNKFSLGTFKFSPAAQNQLMKIAYQTALKTGWSGGVEGLTEAIEGASQEFFQFLFEHDPSIFQGFLKRRKEEFALGAVGGAAARGLDIATQQQAPQVTEAAEGPGVTEAIEIANLPQDVMAAPPEPQLGIKRGALPAEIEAEIERISGTEEGMQKLQELSAKDRPSRKDFRDAGFRRVPPTAQRKAISEAFAKAEPIPAEVKIERKPEQRPTAVAGVSATDVAPEVRQIAGVKAIPTEYVTQEIAAKTVPMDIAETARILDVKTSEGISANVAALESIVGADEVSRLGDLGPGSLEYELSQKWPDTDWTQFKTPEDMLEAHAAMTARKEGYDAIWSVREAAPEQSEFIGLTEAAFVPQEAAAKVPAGQIAAPLPSQITKDRIGAPNRPIMKEDVKKRKPKARRQIMRDLMRRAGVTISGGDFKAKRLRKAAGYYRFITNMRISGRELAIKKEFLTDIGTGVHEVAHFFDDKFNFTGLKTAIGTEATATSVFDKAVAANPANISAITKMAQYDYDPNDARIFEGFAECLRLYVTASDPRTVLDPEVLAFMEEQIFTNPDVAEFVNETRADVLSYDQQNDFDKLNHAIHTLGSELITPNESFFARYDNITKKYGGIPLRNAIKRSTVRAMFDSNFDLTVAEQRMEEVFKEHWNLLSPGARRGKTAEKAWAEVVEKAGGRASQLNMHLPHSAAINAQMAITEGVHEVLTGKKVGKARAPREIFKDFSEQELQEFSSYMVARVGLERMIRKGIQGKRYRVGEMDSSVMVRIVEGIHEGKNATKFRAAAKEVTDYFNDLVDLQHKEGLISKQERDLIKKSHEVYMPFFRQKNREGVSRPSTTMGVKSSFYNLKTGSDAPILDVYDALIERTQAVYSAINRHRVESAFLETALGSGVGGEFVTSVKSLDKSLNKKELLQIRVNNGELTEEAAQDIMADDSITELDLITSAAPGSVNADQALIVRMRKGKKEAFRIDPDIYRVATGSNNPQLPTLVAKMLSILSVPMKFSKYMFITANIAYFTPKNMIRDYKTALIKGLQDIDPNDTRSGVLFRAAKEIGRGAKKVVKDDRSEVDKLFDMAGGSRTTLLRTSTDMTHGGLVSKWSGRKFKRETFGKGKKFDARDSIVTGMEKLEAINNAIELAPRKAAFVNTLKNISESTGEFKINDDGSIDGEVPQWAIGRAINNALEVTVNFNRRGELAPVLEPLLLFYNAGMQGTYSQILTIKNIVDKYKAGDTRPAKRLVAAMAGGMAARAMFLYAMSQLKDEEGNSLLDRVLETSEDYTRDNDVIPLPILGGIYDLIVPREREWKFVSNMIDIAVRESIGNRKIKSFGDFANAVVDFFQEEAASRIPITGGPISMAAQLYGGYDLFRNRSIETRKDKQYLPQFRYNEYTSGPAKTLSRLGLAKYGGLSPKEIDFIARNTIGSMPFNMADWLATSRLDRAPFIGPFISRGVPRASLNDLYMVSERNRQNLNSYADGMIQFPGKEVEEMRDREVTLGAAQRIISAIRQEDDSVLSEQMKARYITGVARWALDRRELPRFPNPIKMYDDPKLPKKTRIEVVKVIKSIMRKPRKTEVDTLLGRRTYAERRLARIRVLKKLRREE